MWGVFAFGSWMLSIGIQPPCPILCHALELQNTCWGKDTACSCHACHACGRPGSNTCTALETWQIRLPDYTIQITTEGRHVVSPQQADIRVIRVTQCFKKNKWLSEGELYGNICWVTENMKRRSSIPKFGRPPCAMCTYMRGRHHLQIHMLMASVRWHQWYASDRGDPLFW